MFEAEKETDPLEALAAEFTERQRRGESPSIAEYSARYPELAAEIEEVFPTIAVMEQLKAHKEHSRSRVSLGGIQLDRLGDFRILGEIGRGGMGIVYEAYQESLGRHVAMKVLPRQTLLDPHQLRRFHREAQTAARLHHTNIVPVFGVGEDDGFHYIVMQLIDGAGLDAVLTALRRPSVVAEAARVPQAIAVSRQGLATAGQNGMGTSSSRDGTEVARLARALAEGRFEQLHGFEKDESQESGGDDLSAQEPLVAGRRSSKSAAATEEFSLTGGTRVGEGSPAESPAPGPASLDRDEAVLLSPHYWWSVAAIGKQLAEALQYAHQHHTLHRDIKPANLLLDSQGVAWITDFGLAKAMELDNVTQTGTVVGTLRYMPPEQFSGDTDARGDIYGLGLTLYEMLTLRPAFEDNNRNSLVTKVARGSVLAPRKVNSAIPRDLETVVLKAMAREPRDRYATAGDLARDLECFLEDRPIRARRTSGAERLWRWARRNRTVAGLMACSVVLLVAVAVVASVGYVRTARANALEQAQRRKAEEISALAVEALDSIFRQFASDRTAPASASLRVSDTEDPIAVPVQPVLSKQTAALLEDMLKFYDRLAQQGGDDARLRGKIAQANRRVGDIRQRLGQYAESKNAYRKAIDLYKPIAKASPGDMELRTEIARIQNELGNVYFALKDGQAGFDSHKDALATLGAESGEPSASPECRCELARTYYFLGKYGSGPAGPFMPGPGGPGERRSGPPGFIFDPHWRKPPFPLVPPQEGEERLDKALAIWWRLKDDDCDWPPSGPGPRPRPEHDRRDAPPPMLGGDRREGHGFRQKAIDILEQLVTEYPSVPGYHHLLARCYREAQPFFAASSGSLSKAMDILEKLAADYPDVADYRYDLSETYAMLGDPGPWGPQNWEGGNSQWSPAMLEKALALSEQLVAEHPNIHEYAISSVGIRLRLNNALQHGDDVKAEASLRKTLDALLNLAGRFPNDYSFCRILTAGVQRKLGELLYAHGRLPEARQALQDCIATCKDILSTDPKAGHFRFFLGLNYEKLADVLRDNGENQASQEARRHAEELRPKVVGPFGPG
jgi:eukaryotic-like serine/threonine-protein kinase